MPAAWFARAPSLWPRPAVRAQGTAKPGIQALVLEELARINWINKSNVAALREGVIEKMELQIGMPVKKDGVIGVLHHEIAELTVKKNELQAEGDRPRGKGESPEGSRRFGRGSQHTAERSTARNGLRGRRRQGRGRAQGRRSPDQGSPREPGHRRADLDLAKHTLDEHTILAPFDGIVLKRMKHPGESVRANEAVIQLGDLSKLSADAYVPLEYAFRVKEGRSSRSSRASRRGAASRCRSRRNDSAARSPLSIRRSSRSPRRPCGSGPSLRTRGDLRPGLMVR